jgi:hypothetical protein
MIVRWKNAFSLEPFCLFWPTLETGQATWRALWKETLSLCRYKGLILEHHNSAILISRELYSN